MNLGTDILRHPYAQHLGWALLHFVWQGTLLAAAYAFVRAALRRGSPNLRYWIGGLTLVFMLAAPAITFYLMESGSMTVVDAAIPLVSPTGLQSGATQDPASWPRFEFVKGLTTPLDGILQFADGVLPGLVLFWLTGVLALSARLTVSGCSLHRLCSQRVAPLDAALLQRFEEVKQKIRVSRAVRLMRSTLVEVPTLIGWLRPVILLPLGCLTGLTPKQLELILAHELAHLRRNDYWLNLFQLVVETLLFYHPLVWWVSRCVREERELCCDDLAVKVCGDRVEYARALATLEALRNCPRTVAFAASGGSLVTRVRRVLGLAPEARKRGWQRPVGALLVAVGLLSIGAAFVFYLLTPAEYVAIARISVEGGGRLGAKSALDSSTPSDPSLLGNELELLRSPTILRAVVENLGLARKWATSSGTDRAIGTQEAVESLQRRVTIRTIANTGLVDIRVTSQDREEAAAIANAIAETYRAWSLDREHSRSELVMEELVTQLDRQTAKVEAMRKQVDELRIHLVSDLDPSEVQTTLDQKHLALEQELTRAHAEYILDTTKLDELKRLSRDELRKAALTALPADPLLPQLYTEAAQVEQNLASLRSGFGSEHPEVSKKEAERKLIEKQIEERLDGILSGMDTQVRALKARREVLEQLLTENRKRALDGALNIQPYFQAKRDLETMQKTRDGLILRVEQEKIEASMPRGFRISIVDRAETPFRAIRPQSSLSFALSTLGLVSLLSGMGLRGLSRDEYSISIDTPTA